MSHDNKESRPQDMPPLDMPSSHDASAHLYQIYIDKSGSMKKKLAIAHRAINKIITMVGTDNYSVSFFSDREEKEDHEGKLQLLPLQPIIPVGQHDNTNNQVVNMLLGLYEPHGRTYLWHRIGVDLCRLRQTHKGVYKTIHTVVVTDGEDNESPGEWCGMEGSLMLKKLAQNLGIELTISFAHIPCESGDDNVVGILKNNMKIISDLTAGTYKFVNAKEDIDDFSDKLNEITRDMSKITIHKRECITSLYDTIRNQRGINSVIDQTPEMTILAMMGYLQSIKDDANSTFINNAFLETIWDLCNEGKTSIHARALHEAVIVRIKNRIKLFNDIVPASRMSLEIYNNYITKCRPKIDIDVEKAKVTAIASSLATSDAYATTVLSTSLTATIGTVLKPIYNYKDKAISTVYNTGIFNLFHNGINLVVRRSKDPNKMNIIYIHKDAASIIDQVYDCLDNETLPKSKTLTTNQLEQLLGSVTDNVDINVDTQQSNVKKERTKTPRDHKLKCKRKLNFFQTDDDDDDSVNNSNSMSDSNNSNNSNSSQQTNIAVDKASTKARDAAVKRLKIEKLPEYKYSCMCGNEANTHDVFKCADFCMDTNEALKKVFLSRVSKYTVVE
jgi:hypothetical protein